MKFIKQLTIIVGIYLIGEVIAITTRLSIPGSVIGMLLLFFALITGKLLIDDISDTSNFLLGNLPILFIPPCIGLVNAYVGMKDYILAIIVVVFTGTFFITIVTGLVIQLLIGRKAKHD